MPSYQDDLDDVSALLDLYIEGANGDVDKLRRAFHPTATMMRPPPS